MICSRCKLESTQLYSDAQFWLKPQLEGAQCPMYCKPCYSEVLGKTPTLNVKDTKTAQFMGVDLAKPGDNKTVCFCLTCVKQRDKDSAQVAANEKYIESLGNFVMSDVPHTRCMSQITIPGAVEYTPTPPMFTLTEHEQFNGYTQTCTFSAPTLDGVFQMRSIHRMERAKEKETKKDKSA